VSRATVVLSSAWADSISAQFGWAVRGAKEEKGARGAVGPSWAERRKRGQLACDVNFYFSFSKNVY
jgi:hypothetical protein